MVASNETYVMRGMYIKLPEFEFLIIFDLFQTWFQSSFNGQRKCSLNPPKCEGDGIECTERAGDDKLTSKKKYPKSYAPKRVTTSRTFTQRPFRKSIRNSMNNQFSIVSSLDGGLEPYQSNKYFSVNKLVSTVLLALSPYTRVKDLRVIRDLRRTQAR